MFSKIVLEGKYMKCAIYHLRFICDQEKKKYSHLHFLTNVKVGLNCEPHALFHGIHHWPHPSNNSWHYPYEIIKML